MIREAELGDLPEILECLYELSDISYREWIDIESAFKERASCGNIFTFLKILNNRVVGCATLILERKLSHGGKLCGHLEDVAVRNNYQGQYIGTELVRYIINYCKALNIYKLVLNCSPTNIKFYLGQNFKETYEIEMRMDL